MFEWLKRTTPTFPLPYVERERRRRRRRRRRMGRKGKRKRGKEWKEKWLGVWIERVNNQEQDTSYWHCYLLLLPSFPLTSSTWNSIGKKEGKKEEEMYNRTLSLSLFIHWQWNWSWSNSREKEFPLPIIPSLSCPCCCKSLHLLLTIHCFTWWLTIWHVVDFTFLSLVWMLAWMEVVKHSKVAVLTLPYIPSTFPMMISWLSQYCIHPTHHPVKGAFEFDPDSLPSRFLRTRLQRRFFAKISTIHGAKEY